MARSSDITDEMIQTLAARAWFVFEIAQREPFIYSGERSVTACEGVDGLNEMLKFFQDQPDVTVQLDFGGIQQDQRFVTADDVQALKEAYIAIYGNTNRPPVS